MAESLLHFPARINEQDVRFEKLLYCLCSKYKATEETIKQEAPRGRIIVRCREQQQSRPRMLPTIVIHIQPSGRRGWGRAHSTHTSRCDLLNASVLRTRELLQCLTKRLVI